MDAPTLDTLAAAARQAVEALEQLDDLAYAAPAERAEQAIAALEDHARAAVFSDAIPPAPVAALLELQIALDAIPRAGVPAARYLATVHRRALAGGNALADLIRSSRVAPWIEPDARPLFERAIAAQLADRDPAAHALAELVPALEERVRTARALAEARAADAVRRQREADAEVARALEAARKERRAALKQRAWNLPRPISVEGMADPLVGSALDGAIDGATDETLARIEAAIAAAEAGRRAVVIGS